MQTFNSSVLMAGTLVVWWLAAFAGPVGADTTVLADANATQSAVVGRGGQGARFVEAMGYAPAPARGRPGMLVRPDGDCSTPTGGTVFGFDDACREHDLAYDVLRFRHAAGEPVRAAVRWVADARFGLRMLERCAGFPGVEGFGCLAVAGVYVAGVTVNSLRQGYGPPVEETGLEVGASSLAMLALVALPFAGARAFRWRLRRQDADLAPPGPGLAWSGSPASLVRWADLGREGRRLLSRPSVAPGAVRVLVEVDCARGIERRVALALAEAERLGAFTRATVCVAVPTGSGWLNPHAVESLEKVTGGGVGTGHRYGPELERAWRAPACSPDGGAARPVDVGAGEP
ncbi:MAG: hypothetical protein GX593_13820 [Actinomycetales bacterium]|nr:hypothetical protein [Actinomycetales bacterium]